MKEISWWKRIPDLAVDANLRAQTRLPEQSMNPDPTKKPQ